MSLLPLITTGDLRVEFYPKCSDGIPADSESYWRGETLVPSYVDLFPGIDLITKVDIEIDGDQTYTRDIRDDFGLKQLTCHEACVRLTTLDKMYTLGLHLFPTYRFGRGKVAEDASLEISILKSGSKTTVDLPFGISSALLNSLTHGKLERSSCIQFTNDLFTNTIGSVQHRWKLRLKNEEAKPADQFKFGIKLPNGIMPKHSAIMLDSNLTLSQLGRTCLRVMTTAQIEQFYRTNFMEHSYCVLDT